MLPAGLVAGDGTWQPNIELFLTPGTDRSHAGAGVLFPLRQDANSMTFLNGQLVVGENSTNEANIGLGHRWFSPDRKRIYGAYGFFDTRESENDRRWNQLSIGGEMLMDSWDLRANIYYPIDDEDKWDTSSSLGGQAFQGNQVVGVQTTTGFYEEALHGFDAEVGYLIPGLAWETRAFAGGYYYDGDIVDSMTGVRVRAETRPMKNIALSLAYQDDDLFDSQATLELRYSFGYKAEKGHRTLEERMIQFPGRDIDIIETSGLSPRDVTKTSSTQVALANDVVHIDNTAGAGGDGSFEDPFDSIGACEASGECAGDPADYVFLHAGDSRSGTPYDPIDGIELAPGQSLIGEGVDFMGIAAGDHPVIEWDFAANGPGDIITLADDNTVAGLELRGAARDRVLHPDQIANPGAYIYVEGNAIAGYNVTGFNIRDNIISNPSTFPVPYGTAGGAVPGTSPAYNP
ncbi:MAG: inverse autotransporter beta domain-containing protein, partial [Gammaproteobacteria bacterium]